MVFFHSCSALKKRITRRLRRLPIGRAHLRWQLELAASAPLVALLDKEPSLLDRPLHRYLNRHWDAAQRLEALRDHYRWLAAPPRQALQRALIGAEEIQLASIELKSGGYYLLKLRRSLFKCEGEAQISVESDQGQTLYTVTFLITGRSGAETLCIGGLQGPAPELGNQAVKSAAKQMYGLRSKNLLVSALYALVEHYRLTGILAISDRAHPKRTSLSLASSYDSFWLELGGSMEGGGWYRLPPQEPRRDIAAVKSQHRSAFRHREALRAQTIEQLHRNLNGSADDRVSHLKPASLAAALALHCPAADASGANGERSAAVQ